MTTFDGSGVAPENEFLLNVMCALGLCAFSRCSVQVGLFEHWITQVWVGARDGGASKSVRKVLVVAEFNAKSNGGMWLWRYRNRILTTARRFANWPDLSSGHALQSRC